MKKTKNYRLKLTKHAKFVVSVRPYRTSRAVRHSKRSKGVTLPTYLLLLPTKELGFYFERPKRRKISSKQLRFVGQQSILPFFLIILGFSGIVYFSVQNADSNDQSIEPVSSFAVPTTPIDSQKSSQDRGLAPSEPTRIRIKRVEINAPVQEVGQNKDKSIEVPPLFENVTGWYNLGPTPGEIGPAIIVGHVDTIEGPSVFYRLKDLSPGDIIEVTRKDKKVVKFKVTGLEQFSQNKFPTEKVYGNIDHAGLRLITCGGTFNQQTQQYTANTVVFAEMIQPKS